MDDGGTFDPIPAVITPRRRPSAVRAATTVLLGILDAHSDRDAVPGDADREPARRMDLARRRAVHLGLRGLRHGPHRRRHGRPLVLLGPAGHRHPDRDRWPRDHGVDHAGGPARASGLARIEGDGDRRVRRAAQRRPGRRPARRRLRARRAGGRHRRVPGRARAHEAGERAGRHRLAVDLLHDERVQQRGVRPGRRRPRVHGLREPAADAAHHRRAHRDRRARVRHRRATCASTAAGGPSPSRPSSSSSRPPSSSSVGRSSSGSWSGRTRGRSARSGWWTRS